ncbi:MAG: hypothetical protein PVH89_05100 [Gammaproteobacteria bacterium]|jgi:hypothetical protein
MTGPVLTSVTRVSDLAERPFEIMTVPRPDWQMGDYVAGQLIDASGYHTIELPNGRMMEVAEGDLVVGAFGARAATIEACGDWREIAGNEFQALTPAGLFGQLTSVSPFIGRLLSLRYAGHVTRDGHKVTMKNVLTPVPETPLRAPVVLITGTSMSSGKTLSGRLVVRLLSQLGLRVVGAKLTGAARYHDVLSYADAGAVRVFDFVDAGLPSTVTDPDDFKTSLTRLLSLIANEQPDVLVAEAGASPLEPYNGKAAIDMLGESVRFNVLCASDPYAVLGVASAFQRQPDIVAGGSANTQAAIDLVRKLTGLQAMNLLSRSSHEPLRELLVERLGLA